MSKIAEHKINLFFLDIIDTLDELKYFLLRIINMY
jgi:hypothetical protein